MYIQTEATPNPATLKFLPGREVSGRGPVEIQTREEAAVSPLAQALFEIPGVAGVMFGDDFISVTKDESEWQHLKPAILGAIMEHFLSETPLIDDNAELAGRDETEFFDEADADVVEAIKELLETRVRPAVAGDGGDIKFRGFRDGIVYLSMRGACAGCPSSTATLKHGIQNLLRHFVPEVKEVEQSEN